MKKLITLLLLLQNIACTNTSQEYIKINPEAQTIQTELIISDKTAPRMYYDIAVIDSCMAVSTDTTVEQSRTMSSLFLPRERAV